MSTTFVAVAAVGSGMFSAVMVNTTCWPIGTASGEAPEGTLTDLPTAMSISGSADVTVADEELFSTSGSSTTGEPMVAVFTSVPASPTVAVTVAMTFACPGASVPIVHTLPSAEIVPVDVVALRPVTPSGNTSVTTTCRAGRARGCSPAADR